MILAWASPFKCDSIGHTVCIMMFSMHHTLWNVCPFFTQILTIEALRFFNLNFHPPEVMSRYRDPQLQAGENYSYLYIL